MDTLNKNYSSFCELIQENLQSEIDKVSSHLKKMKQKVGHLEKSE